MISSRTPEGRSGRCSVCGHEFRLDPSRPPGDAPCPDCGTLNWFDPPDEYVLEGDRLAALCCAHDDLGEFPMAVGDVDGEVARWEAAGRPTPVVVDFTGVGFVDSAVLGRLIRLYSRLTTRGARLRLRGLSPDVRSVFDLTKLTQMFDPEE